MNDEQIERAFAFYGFQDIERVGEYKGYRNTSYVAHACGRTLNLILYKDEQGIAARITRANRFGDYLADKGLPARRTADPRILCIKSATRIRYAALYEYLDGDTIPWEAYTQKHLKVLGMALGKLHAVAQSMHIQVYPTASAEYTEICERMQQYYADKHVAHAMHDKLGLSVDLDIFQKYFALLRHCTKLPNQQLLHMDFVRSNVLFSESISSALAVDGIAVTGIIDFEKAAAGHPVFDVARTLAFLLVDSKYKSEEKIRKYFLYSGYVKRGMQNLPHITYAKAQNKCSVLEELVSMFLLYDFYKFMRHNPYEFLEQNEHYMRTRDMLLERKVIQNA